jgi:uncharacterized protein with HEPN domain
MKQPDDSVFLHHILDATSQIESYLFGVDLARFKRDALLQDGVIRQIQIIGEASRRLSVALRSRYPTIAWLDIIGMRNRLVHDYFTVDRDLLFSTATQDVPALKKDVEVMLREISSPET